VVEVTNLSRRFGRRRALDGVSLTLGAGDCLALFGPNGAGKSTLVRVLAGLLEPSGGAARVAGLLLPGGPAVRALVGLVAHQSMLYPALSARENLVFAAQLFGVRDPRAAAAFALERVGVLDRADTPVRSLSRGLQQRVAIARAAVHAPRLLLLDEPFTGLDPAGCAGLTEILAERRRAGAASIVVTHQLADGLALATHVAVLCEGRVVRYEPRGTVDPERYADGYRELVAAAV
jgi:heme exporter protein A